MQGQESDLTSQTQHWELLANTWPSERQEVTLSERGEEPGVTLQSPQALRKNLEWTKGGGNCLHEGTFLYVRCLSAASHSFLICREWNRDPGPRIAWVPGCKAIEPWHWDSNIGSDGARVWVLLTKLEQTRFLGSQASEEEWFPKEPESLILEFVLTRPPLRAQGRHWEVL